MEIAVPIKVVQQDAEVLQSLLTVGVNLSAIQDRRKMLDMLLGEARKLAHAEGGSLYIARDRKLKFVACQNDKLPLPQIVQSLLDKETAVSKDSLAGFVASSGRVMNIPDAYRLAGGVPFRHNRDFDTATGYRTVSMLALPLKTPDGKCVGVLQLINCVGRGGAVVPFPGAESSGLSSLAAMAAMTVHNWLLQEDLKRAHLESIIRLSTAAEFRDADTARHIRNICTCSAAIAKAAGFPAEEVELIRYASAMHDVGKIGIPDSSLLKPGPLTAEERRIMEGHTRIGAKILGEPRSRLMEIARAVALGHHERWDGKGYPDKLGKDHIPVEARVVALADAFDALVSKRCYKEAYPVDAALDILRADEARKFDPGVTEALFKAVDDICASRGGDSE
jgi:HD-GYP domain-containing protein (c-di-GMP phosphodiesterase class II)